MKGEIVRTYTEDGLNTQGILCEPVEEREDMVVIHVHGSYGNFYENFFLDDMAEEFAAHGVSFLSGNTRGRDYYADFKIKKPDGYDSRRIGGIREVFSECKLDINAWVKLALSRGFRKIVLQGHSLGAMKVIYYLAETKKPEIVALVLISPPDNFGIQYKHFGERFEKDLRLAKDMMARKSDELMPAESYFDPITAEAFVALFGGPKTTGMFSYFDKSLLKDSPLREIRCPILATFGTIDEAVANDVEYCAKTLKETAVLATSCTTKIIEKANHSYHGKERELARIVASWVKSL